MLTQEEWEVVRHDLIETGFFEPAGRTKTMKAIRKVMEKMPADELQSLRDKVSIIFAPAPDIDGEVFHCSPSHPISNQKGSQQRRVLVYLSPKIERYSQGRIESIIAHEFAHALLHAPDALDKWWIEQESDQKVQSWGFKAAYPKTQHSDIQSEADKKKLPE